MKQYRAGADKVELAKMIRNVWAFTPKDSIPEADLCRLDFWSHVAAKLRSGDIIEVIPDDLASYVRLIVMRSDRVWTQVKVLEYVDLKEKKIDGEAQLIDTSKADDLEVKFRGRRKYSVVRKSDGAVLHEDMSELEAIQWKADHVKAMAV